MLGTTATANDRVVADVVEQLGRLRRRAAALLPRPAGRGPACASRCSSCRGRRERLAWLVENLPQLPGSGIVYTLTKRDAEQVAAFLSAHGITALAYSGEQETDDADRDRGAAAAQRGQGGRRHQRARDGLRQGRPDASSSTTRRPGSVVSYYQQVGRAGRGVDHADVVLLRGGEDRRIQDFFIEQAFPARERVTAVLERARGGGRRRGARRAS